MRTRSSLTRHWFFPVAVALLLPVSGFTQTDMNVALNRAVWQSGAADYDHTGHLTTDPWPSTYWKSKTSEGWIYTDLGSITPVSSVMIGWGNEQPESFRIEVSGKGHPNQPEEWISVGTQNRVSGKTDSVRFSEVPARFVRISLSGSSRHPEIHTLKVYGKPVRPSIRPTGKVRFTSNGPELNGSVWQVKRESFIRADRVQLSTPGFFEEDWMPATVPGTPLTDYLTAGAIPDPVFGDQQLMISDWFFTAPFWYRTEFESPKAWKNKLVWLHLDGINWKAEVWVNGGLAGRVDGAYIRGKMEISRLVTPGKPVAIAIRIQPNDNPGAVTEQHLNDPDGNGGIIGLDSPSILASIGWNWMPTIRGRNAGIWAPVRIETTDGVTLSDPLVITDFDLPDTSQVNIQTAITVTNHGTTSWAGELTGQASLFRFTIPVSLNPGESKVIRADPGKHPALKVQNPSLWWPNGYGNQPLDTLVFSVTGKSGLSDRKQVVFGYREFSYLYEHSHLRLQINGVPLIIRGGNWGMAESMMRYSDTDFNRAVRLHKEMNFNMIRNWVGMIGNDAFYDACDRYGLLIWDDFWLANPVDGPHPADENLFMANARDKVLNRRNRASVALWVGRNEGYPPATLDSALRVLLQETDHTRHYLSSSADRPVTGLGPYENKSPDWYFENRGTSFHSEQGIVAPPVLESFQAMMPERFHWPVNDMWGKHDWTQPRVRIYQRDMDSLYGKPVNLKDFARKAWFVNMEGPKGMVESWQYHRGPGVLLWMSHPAWPSLICQTYDYWLEPTSAFFAMKTACSPLHLFMHPSHGTLHVSNNLQRPLVDGVVEVLVADLSGRIVSESTHPITAEKNKTASVSGLQLKYDGEATRFIRLRLLSKAGEVLASNFYWQKRPDGHYRDLASMDQTSIQVSAYQTGKRGQGKIKIKNTGSAVAPMVRFSLIDGKTGERVLPVFWSDNFIGLMPGESREVTMDLESDISPEFKLKVEGWNVEDRLIPLTEHLKETP